MISNVRLRAMSANEKNEWVPKHTMYDGPSFEEALTLAIRGMSFKSDPIELPGITFSLAQALYQRFCKTDTKIVHDISTHMRLEITPRGRG